MKLNDFKLESFFAKYEFNVKYLLCASDCESFSIGELLDLEDNVEFNLKNHWLGYTESLGHPDLRNQIAKLYDKVGYDDILVFSGAEEGIFVFMNVFLNKGDHVIVQFPAYQSLFEVANSIGCEVTKWHMGDENNWELDIDLLQESIKKNTKCIVLNLPHSPTGYITSEKKYKDIVKIAEENDIFIFSDEVYRFLEYNEDDHLPAMCDYYKDGLSLGVMSKTFGLAGLRIGWIATQNHQLLERLSSFKNYTTICNSAPSEFLSILALRHKDTIINRNLGIIKNNLLLLDAFFENFSKHITWVRPKAGSIAFPRLLIEKDVEEFCLELLKKEGVLLMPSTKFDYGSSHFRIGFGRKNFPECLKHFKAYLQRNL
jgi:aspartate/methionine/tyrosine aminotransferase